jgi:hypothetical protein
MSKRMGDESKPPVAITYRQVRWAIDRLEALWKVCPTADVGGRREIAAAAVSTLLAWLGWLRSREMFSLTWGDTTITRPADGPSIGLPSGVGAVELRLLAETKTNRTKVADIVISYATASGLIPGLWMERLRHLWPEARASDPVIRGSTGSAWDSRYFRTKHMYVWLHQMRAEGDPFLQAFTHTPGNRIEDKYYGMGSWRRGARAQCAKRNNGTEKATPDEIYEHGRWNFKINKEDMATRYNEYGIDDRIHITLTCM